MTPIQQLMLGVGASKKTYMDDVFSTYVYKGPVTNNRIYNNIDLSGEGGLVWIKHRDTINNISEGHYLFDSERSYIQLTANSNDAQDGDNFAITVNNDGFNVNGHSRVGGSGQKFASYSFRKAKGFFDVVTYNGSSSAQNISHSLGCQPGMIMVKKTSGSDDWAVWHRSLSNTAQGNLVLNSTAASGNDSTIWNNTAPTASVFSVGQNGVVNESGATYVAYVFAGGASTATTARSCDFSGSNYLELDDHADFHFGGGAFTVECWIKGTANNSNRNIIGQWASGQMGWSVFWAAGNQGHSAWGFKWGTSGSNEYQVSDILLDDDQWHHIAVSCDGNNLWLYRDGIQRKKIDFSSEDIHNSTAACRIANDGWDSALDCHISNVRVVKGTAVYTSSFRVPTEPLTNITNTKLLCCNGTTPTFATVQPGYASLTNNGSVTSSTVTPFDDPANFKFGENKEGIVKCGSYVGNGNADGPEIPLGFEPQWILLKETSGTGNWSLYDSMRGIVTGENDKYFFPNSSGQETVSFDQMSLTATGFKIGSTGSISNSDGDTYVYYAIRRPDGYVGKPVEAGTDVFAMDTGASSSVIPNFDSNFPVDYGFFRDPSISHDWYTASRLTGDNYMRTDATNAETSMTGVDWDSNVGWTRSTGSSSIHAWMWKRHAGFDVVTYTGKGTAQQEQPHSLGKVPEMIWVKRRDNTENWAVYHKGQNSGTNPEQYTLALNTAGTQNSSGTGTWSTHSSTHFGLGTGSGSNNWTNVNGDKYLALLFTSVDGISKVGSYTGTAASLDITTGFQPRFLMIKREDAGSSGTHTSWFILDTSRGWSSGNNDAWLRLDNTDTGGSHDFGSPSSNGFNITAGDSNYNGNGARYIYYAHA